MRGPHTPVDDLNDISRDATNGLLEEPAPGGEADVQVSRVDVNVEGACIGREVVSQVGSLTNDQLQQVQGHRVQLGVVPLVPCACKLLNITGMELSMLDQWLDTEYEGLRWVDDVDSLDGDLVCDLASVTTHRNMILQAG